MDHTALRELTGAYALAALAAEEQTGFEAHLDTCGECLAEVRSFQWVIERLALAVPHREPPAALRDRVVAAVGHGSRATPPPPFFRRITVATCAAVLLMLVAGGYALGRKSCVTGPE